VDRPGDCPARKVAEVEVPAAGSSRLTVVIQTGFAGPSSNRDLRIIVTPSGSTSMVVVTGISNRRSLW
jgi:hypothetical protein